MKSRKEKDYAVFCIINGFPVDENKIALVKQGVLYKFPGGKKDGDETPETTAHRELFEEINCEVTLKEKVYERDLKSHKFILFWATYQSGQYYPKSGADNLIFVSSSEISKMIERGELFDQHAKAFTELLREFQK